jgi:hypothetical protein
MKISVAYLACCGVFALTGGLAVAQTPTPEQTREANIKAYISMLRKDIKKDKVSVLTELMELSPDQAAKFWPLYNEYDKSLTKLGDERVVFIRMYADNYAALSADMATKIAMGVMDVESRRIELRKQYFQRISQALTPKDAVRWLQVEAQIEKLVDLQILANLPIAE